MGYEIPDDTKVLIATPNYQNIFESQVHANHIDCVDTWIRGGLNFSWTIIGRTFVHFARTQMCQVAMEGGFTHILWLDDDAIIDPNILPRFIEHDKDVVIAPYPLRKMPHEIGVLKSTTGNFHDHPSYKNITIADLDQGLIEVDGGGTHCMLIKTSILQMAGETTDDGVIPDELYEIMDRIENDEDRILAKNYIGVKPDTSNRSFEEEDNQGIPYFVMPKRGTEDMYWCYRAKRKGIEIWCDTDVFADHMGFTPVITRAWREHAENSISPDRLKEQTKLSIIPGSTDKHSKFEIHRDEAVNLI